MGCGTAHMAASGLSDAWEEIHRLRQQIFELTRRLDELAEKRKDD